MPSIIANNSHQQTLPWYRSSLAYSLYLHALAIAFISALTLWPKGHNLTPKASHHHLKAPKNQTGAQGFVLAQIPYQQRPDKNTSPKSSKKQKDTQHSQNRSSNQNEAHSKTSKGDAPATADSGQKIKKNLYKRLRTAIERHKSYPYQAYKMGLSGQSHLAFTLDPSGKITDLRIIRRSEVPSFDQASLNAVRSASPFAVPAPGIAKPMRFVMIIEYSFK